MKNTLSHSPQHVGKLKEIELLVAQNELEGAALALNRLGAVAPNDPRIYLLGSRLAEASGHHKGVLESALKAYEVAPQWPFASLYVARVLAGRGLSDEGMRFAKQAVQLAQRQKSLDLDLLHKAAGIAQSLGLYAQALVWLGQAEQRFGTDGGICPRQ